MLLDFSVENYRSFYESKTLTLEAQKLSESRKLASNVAEKISYRLLKTVAINGANSSGKSNLLYAIAAMRHCVLSSVKLNSEDSLIAYEPFLLLKGNAEPTRFEITFLRGAFCYRYGFSLSEKIIGAEWLFRRSTSRSKERALFVRQNGEGIQVDEKLFPEGSGIESKVNDNRLFLSLSAQLGGEVSKEIISWFQTELKVLSGIDNAGYREFSKRLFHNNAQASKEALVFFRKLQLGFEDISTREEEVAIPDGFPEELSVLMARTILGQKRIEVDSLHNLYDADGKVCDSVSFSFERNESSGTRKLFDISGPIFDTLHRGAVLVIDELDAKMHPLISQQIIQLFNDSHTNPFNAQLIFTTHNTHLLSSKMFRRDQIWFTEKNSVEQTDLYCLTDIVLPDGTKPRNDANYEKNYMAGRYGAIPYIINE